MIILPGNALIFEYQNRVKEFCEKESAIILSSNYRTYITFILFIPDTK